MYDKKDYPFKFRITRYIDKKYYRSHFGNKLSLIVPFSIVFIAFLFLLIFYWNDFEFVGNIIILIVILAIIGPYLIVLLLLWLSYWISFKKLLRAQNDKNYVHLQKMSGNDLFFDRAIHLLSKINTKEAVNSLLDILKTNPKFWVRIQTILVLSTTSFNDYVLIELEKIKQNVLIDDLTDWEEFAFAYTFTELGKPQLEQPLIQVVEQGEISFDYFENLGNLSYIKDNYWTKPD